VCPKFKKGGRRNRRRPKSVGDRVSGTISMSPRVDTKAGTGVFVQDGSFDAGMGKSSLSKKGKGR